MIMNLFVVLTFCLLGLTTTFAESAANNCPAGWISLHRGCYKFVDRDTKSWEDAAQVCSSEGGELTSIQSTKEKNEIDTYLRRQHPLQKKWWVGFERKENSGTNWMWIADGQPLNNQLIRWKRKGTIARRGKVCGMLENSNGLTVSNSRCSKREPFICEFHFIKSEDSAEEQPSTADDGGIKQTSVVSDGATHGTDEGKQQIDRGGIRAWDEDDVSAEKPEVSPSEVGNSREEDEEGFEGDQDTFEVEAKKKNQNSKKMNNFDPENNNAADEPEVEDVTVTDRPEVENSTVATDGDDSAPMVDSADSENNSTTVDEDVDEDNDNGSDDVDDDRTTQSELNTTTRTTAPTTTITPNTISTTTARRGRPQRLTNWEIEFRPYRACYIPGMGNSLKQMVLAARDFYGDEDDDGQCPQAKIRGLDWPETDSGEIARVRCRRGKGFATFTCGEEPNCWRGQPDTRGCASDKLQSLLKRIEKRVETGGPGQNRNETDGIKTTFAPPTVEESIEMTSQLVQVTSAEEETTMDDVLVTSHVITALTKRSQNKRVKKDKKEVEKIVENVVKAGSNLVSEDKREMWEEMSSEDKVRSASTLLVAIETATTSMAEEIDEPTVHKQKDENVELELRVLDLEEVESENKEEIVYDSEQSENTFSIPVKTLKSLSKGRLARAVFITHYSMSDILGGRDMRRRGRRIGVKSSVQPTETPSKQGQPQLNDEFRGGHKYTSAGGGTDREYPDKEKMDKGTEADGNDVVGDTGPQIASYILSASVGSETHVVKLPEPITFTMRHVVEMDERHIPLCSFWNVSNGLHQGFWSQDGCGVVRTNQTHTKCECDHMTNFAVLMDVHGVQITAVHKSVLRTVTIIGCCISCAALLASFVTFSCISSIQGERNSIHKNLALCLLLAELLFVFGIDRVEHQVSCAVIAGFLHFLFLAAFTWMFMEGIHIIFMLVQVFDASRSRLPYYYLAGYGVPTVIVGASLLFYYEGYGTSEFCWLTNEYYFIWAFAGPISIILLVNAIFLTYALSTVCRHADYVFTSKDKSPGSGLRSWVQGALALEVLLGLTWIFGYFVLNDDYLPVAYIFTILNSLQGLFIFVFHCLLSKKIQKEYAQVMRGVIPASAFSSRSGGATASSNTRRTSQSHVNNSSSNGHNHYRSRINSNGAGGNHKDLNPGTEEHHQKLYDANKDVYDSKELQQTNIDNGKDQQMILV